MHTTYLEVNTRFCLTRLWSWQIFYWEPLIRQTTCLYFTWSGTRKFSWWSIYDLLWLKLDSASASKPRRTRSVAVLAEIGTLSLEFTQLAQLTGKPKYYDAIDRITNAFQHWQAHTQLPGMWRVYINPSGCSNVEGDDPNCKASDMSSSPVSTNDTFTLGPRSDSLYEYLPKVCSGIFRLSFLTKDFAGVHATCWTRE